MLSPESLPWTKTDHLARTQTQVVQNIHIHILLLPLKSINLSFNEFENCEFNTKSCSLTYLPYANVTVCQNSLV